MTETRFEYEVGTYRESKEGKRDDGRDGLLWLPQQKVLAVADGVRDIGNGNDAMVLFEQLLKEKKGNFREAIFGLLGIDSTFGGIKLPDTPDEKALAIAIGDSPLRLFRNGKVELLLEPDNLWSMLVGMDGLPEKEIPLTLVEESVAAAYFDESQIGKFIARILRLSAFLSYPLEENLKKDLEKGEYDYLLQNNKRRLLQLMINRCKDVLTADLASGSTLLRQKISSGKEFSLQHGDVLSATTDGVTASAAEFSDFFSSGNITAQAVAKILVKRREKKDDATAVVVRVQEMAS